MTRLQTALAALAAGGMVVLCDDAERPTRGELVFAAAEATPTLVALAVRCGSGFLQVAMPIRRCEQLGLTPQCGADNNGLNQCVTVDAKASIGTGISAFDRSRTIQLLAAPDAVADSFTRPGHVVPLRADMKLPCRDYGFAEAAVWLTSTAGVGESAVLSTVIGIVDPTGIAAGRDLERFSEDHGLPLIGIDDLLTFGPISPTLDHHIHVSGQAARLLMFDDGRAKYLCLILGDVVGHVDVPLHVVDPDDAFEGLGTHQCVPHIRLAICSEQDERSRSYLHRQLHESRSAVNSVIQSAGAHSVLTVVDGEPWHAYG